jgi:hypothetical protein
MLAQLDDEVTGPIDEPSEANDDPDGDESEDSDADEDDDDRAGTL